MNQQIIDYLNKEMGLSLSDSYYKHIEIWRNWWQGYYKPFHRYIFNNGQRRFERDMYSLKMAKKVSEDWASILLNQKTEIKLEDERTSLFLQGEDGTGGILGHNRFWRCGNELIEKAFAMGTGAVTVHFENLRMTDKGKFFRTPRTQIKLNYIEAENIIIISKGNGIVTEVAFCSEKVLDSKKYIYLEIHELDENGNYVIRNKYFADKNGQLAEAELPANMFPEIHTNSPVPHFAIISPAIVNNIDGNGGMGMSIYSDAVDALKGIDLAYNNFNSDFYLGQKKVFMNKSLIETDENGKEVAPDDVNQQLFTFVGDGVMNGPDGKQLLQEFNPLLRVEENTKGVQAGLDYLSFKVGFGTKHYQFNAGSIVTAKQYTGDKQDLIQNANKHYTAVEEFLIQLVKAILWAGKTVLGEDINPETPIKIQFDESPLIDPDAERQKDKDDVAAGLMLPWEYRVKWRGETEDEAKKILSEIQTDDELMNFEE